MCMPAGLMQQLPQLTTAIMQKAPQILMTTGNFNDEPCKLTLANI
jgi:hypothetical protein